MMKKTIITIFIIAVISLSIGFFLRKTTEPLLNTTDKATTTNSVTSSENDMRFVVGSTSVKIVQENRITQEIVFETSLDEYQKFSLIDKDSLIITDLDVNFDNHNDLGVLVGDGYGGVNLFYDFYIYNPVNKKFEQNETLSNIGWPKVDLEKKQVISSYRSGPRWYTNPFQFDGKIFIDLEAHPETAEEAE